MNTPDDLPLIVHQEIRQGSIRTRGDVTITNVQNAGGPPSYSLGSFSASHKLKPDAAPSTVLLAEYEVVPFRGREREIMKLTEWLEDAPARSAVLLRAAGGQGKTRLSFEVARLARDQGWSVLVARHRREGARDAGSSSARHEGRSSGVLVLVDYADRWPLRHLLRLIQDERLLGMKPSKLRFLFVGRAETFWRTFRVPLEEQGYVTDTLALQGMAGDASNRSRLYDDAVGAFIELPWLRVDRNTVGQLMFEEVQPGSDHILSIHMAALLAVLAAREGQAVPPGLLDQRAVTRRLIEREVRHWALLADRDIATQIQSSVELMCRGVLVGSLTRGLTYAEAEVVLSWLKASADPRQLLADHRTCYPPIDDDVALSPLYPDRVGEDLIAACLGGFEEATPVPELSDQWAALRIPTMLGTRPGARHDLSGLYGPFVFTSLIEVSIRWPHVAEHYLFPALTADPALAFVAGGPTLVRLCDVPGVESVIDGVAALLRGDLTPLDSRVGDSYEMAMGVAAVTRLVVRKARASNDSQTLLLALLHASVRMSAAGDAEEALGAARESVQLLEWETSAGHIRSFFTYVIALATLGRRLADVGRFDEAARAVSRALSLASQAAVDDATRASLLDQQAMHLSQTGRLSEALAPAREALEIRLKVRPGEPEDLELQADSFHNLSTHLWRAHEAPQSLDLMAQAVAARRELHAKWPLVYAPTLAASLQSYGMMLSKLGHHDRAVPIAQEAVSVSRELVTQGASKRYAPDLAMALCNLALALEADGRRALARRTIYESVTLYEDLSQQRTDLLPDLAMALLNLGHILGTDDPAEAEVHTRRAIGIYEQLPTLPISTRLYYAQALMNLMTFADAAHHDGGIEAGERAIAIYQGMLGEGLKVVGRRYIDALKSLAAAYGKRDEWRTAFALYASVATWLDQQGGLLPDHERQSQRALSFERQALSLSRIADQDRSPADLDNALTKIDTATDARRGLLEDGGQSQIDLADALHLAGTLAVAFFAPPLADVRPATVEQRNRCLSYLRESFELRCALYLQGACGHEQLLGEGEVLASLLRGFGIASAADALELLLASLPAQRPADV